MRLRFISTVEYPGTENSFSQNLPSLYFSIICKGISNSRIREIVPVFFLAITIHCFPSSVVTSSFSVNLRMSANANPVKAEKTNKSRINVRLGESNVAFVIFCSSSLVRVRCSLCPRSGLYSVNGSRAINPLLRAVRTIFLNGII